MLSKASLRVNYRGTNNYETSYSLKRNWTVWCMGQLV